MFDIVIPLGPNERVNIFDQIKYTKKNVIGYRNIYIITNTKEQDLQIDDCIVLDESIFPFKMNDIASYFALHDGKNNRNGWYLQQLIKLYAGFVIEDILDDYLVIDSDVFFLKPLNFINESRYIFTISDEHHIPYFKHMKRLHPSFDKKIDKSGISHHMIFNRNFVKELFDMVEEYHNKNHFWVIFIECVDEHKMHQKNAIESGASEYELYFNFMITHHSNLIQIRQLLWENKSYNFEITENIGFDYISKCAWIK